MISNLVTITTNYLTIVIFLRVKTPIVTHKTPIVTHKCYLDCIFMSIFRDLAEFFLIAINNCIS